MVDTECSQPISSSGGLTKFIHTPKGIILVLEVALCLLMTICKAVSLGCYLWGSIIELVWAIITFIVYTMQLDLHFKFFPWTDFFRAISGSLILFFTSLACFAWAHKMPGEIIGSIFGLLAAAVFGYDTFCIIKLIKELKQRNDIVVIRT